MNLLERNQARLNNIVCVIKETDPLAKIAIVLEGRDSAGKSGTIRELTHFLPTDDFRVMTTKKPTKKIMENWFGWWEKRMPNDIDPLISFYDRSWYSRALVQFVNGWCSQEQYASFMGNVAFFEATHEIENVVILKYWLSISQDEQNARLSDRKTSLLRGWKYSNNDAMALSSYDKMTLAKEALFTSKGQSWNVIDYNDKKEGRVALLENLNNQLMDIFDIDEYDLDYEAWKRFD